MLEKKLTEQKKRLSGTETTADERELSLGELDVDILQLEATGRHQARSPRGCSVAVRRVYGLDGFLLISLRPGYSGILEGDLYLLDRRCFVEGSLGIVGRKSDFYFWFAQVLLDTPQRYQAL